MRSPASALEMVAEEIPEREDLLVRVQLAQGIDPALLQQALPGGARFGLQQCILAPVLRIVDVRIRGNHVVITRKDDGHAGVVESLCMLCEPLEPFQLVLELRSRLGIAIGQVDAAHADAVHVGLDVAAVRIVRIAGQAASHLDGLCAPRENRDAVVRGLPVPHGVVTGLLQGKRREFFIRRLELLQANHVGLALSSHSSTRGRRAEMLFTLKLAIRIALI